MGPLARQQRQSVAVAYGLGFVPSHLGMSTSNAVALDTGMDGEKGGPWTMHPASRETHPR